MPTKPKLKPSPEAVKVTTELIKAETPAEVVKALNPVATSKPTPTPKPPKTPVRSPSSITQFLIQPQPSASVEEGTASEQHLLKIIDQVYSTDDIEVKTDLTPRQINAIARGQLYGARYYCDIIQDLCKNIMTLSVSKNRLGRKEFTEISKSMQSTPEFEEPTLKTRLLGE